MKLVKFASCLAVLIALTEKGYSANPAWKPLTDRGDNADENADRYDVRSPTDDNNCVKAVHIESYQGNKLYTHHECKSHSLLCPGLTCDESKYCFIAGLNKTVVCGCSCSKRSRSGRKLKLKRDDAL